MRILAAENIGSLAVQAMRNHGYDVVSVKESMRGADDFSILSRAVAERRIVVTQDKDFGELAVRDRLPAASGVILFRLSGASPVADQQRMLDVLACRQDWAGHFSVVTDKRIRMRTLPGSRSGG